MRLSRSDRRTRLRSRIPATRIALREHVLHKRVSGSSRQRASLLGSFGRVRDEVHLGTARVNGRERLLDERIVLFRRHLRVGQEGARHP